MSWANFGRWGTLAFAAAALGPGACAEKHEFSDAAAAAGMGASAGLGASAGKGANAGAGGRAGRAGGSSAGGSGAVAGTPGVGGTSPDGAGGEAGGQSGETNGGSNAGIGGMGGSAGTGVVPNQCESGKHNCSGDCVDDDSVDHCGGSCTPCAEPDSGTAICVDGECDIDCGSLKKCGDTCTDGCCVNDDCAPEDDKAGQCDTSTHSCRYDCAPGFKPCGADNCIPEDACCAESDCPGTCQTCSEGACVDVTGADDPDSCAGTCDGSGTCKSKQGQTCVTTSNGCVAGSTCAPDGYCCNTACTQACQACDLPGSEGTCTPLASGAPHGNRQACASDGGTCGGTCTGKSDGTCDYPTKNCAPGPSCSGSDAVAQSKCMTGACVTPAATTCSGGFVCSGTACKTTCGSDSDCAIGYFCEGTSCHLDATQVAAGGTSSYALLSDGTVWAWGQSTYGAIGPQGPTTSGANVWSNVPIKVTSLGAAKAIAAGADHACALLKNNEVWCWGSTARGQLGNNQVTGNGSSPTPVKVQGLPSPAVTAISMYGNTSCALIGSTGDVYCWGDNIYKSAGPTVSGDTIGTATKVTGIGSASAVVTGTTTCVNVSGNMTCWGNNGDSELAQPLGTPGTPPVVMPLGGLGALQQMVVADYHTCALVAGGNVWCWGWNVYGDLGDVSTAVGAHATSPVSVDGLSSGATYVAAGYIETCAILTSGKVACWGGQRNGAIGDGHTDTEGAATPTEVSGLTGVTSLAVNSLHVCAVTGNGAVKCWGNGYFGQLGNGANADASTVVNVKGW